MNKYMYIGPVIIFNRCVVNKWIASTYAQSKSKARSNFSYQFKRQNNLLVSANVTLPGKIIAQ